MNQVTVVIKQKESVMESVFKDFFTFLFIFLCVYVSQESPFYTFLTGSMLLAYAAIKVANIYKKSVNVFDNKDDAIAYINKHEAS